MKDILQEIDENNWGVIIFGITVTTILGIAFVNLVNKFQKSYKEEKKKLSLILIGATTTFIFHIIFNMILPSFFEISKFTEFGALFTLPFSALTAYAIIKFKLFNVKVVSAELLAFILWIFIFIRILIAENLREQFINSIMFVVVVIVGIFLIRSVLREVDQREKLAKLANELETSNEKLKSLDTLKTEFLSLASHQLRSPLTAIKGYSSMLLEGSYGVLADTTQREAIERIFQSSTALAKTVEDFLNVSKIEQGGMKYEFDEIDISKLGLHLKNHFQIN
jgi:signal transduction histidine kinase